MKVLGGSRISTYSNIMTQTVCILYSAAHLYLKAIYELKNPGTIFTGVPTGDSWFDRISYDGPGAEPTLTLGVVATNVSDKLAGCDEMSPGVTPGMWMLHDVLQAMVGRGLADCYVISCRNYTTVEGVKCKVQWGSGYAAERGATHVLDIGGEGKMKLLKGDTGEELWASPANIATPAWNSTIDGLIETQLGEGDRLAIGCTGRWRKGPGGHSDADEVLTRLQADYADNGQVVAVGTVEEDLERKWEHASAKRAVTMVLPNHEVYTRVYTLGSGSSTTQFGDSGDPKCGFTMPLGIHVKGALAGGGLEELRSGVSRHMAVWQGTEGKSSMCTIA